MNERDLEDAGDQLSGKVDVTELITARAYQLFQDRGGEHGHALDDWLRAEREVLTSHSGAEMTSSVTEPPPEADTATATAIRQERHSGRRF